MALDGKIFNFANFAANRHILEVFLILNGENVDVTGIKNNVTERRE